MHMDFTVVWANLPFLIAAAGVTVGTAALVIIGGSVCGVLLGLMRVSRFPGARHAAALYIEIIRGTPLLVVLFVVYFVVPPLVGHRFTAYQAAVIGFIAFISAYIAEDVRSGIASVSRGQRDAGLALGLSHLQTMRFIVLPQAIRRMTPALFNQFIRLLKFTSVASIIGVTELTGAAMAINAREFRPIEILITLAVSYLVMCSLLSLLGRRLNRRYGIVE